MKIFRPERAMVEDGALYWALTRESDNRLEMYVLGRGTNLSECRAKALREELETPGRQTELSGTVAGGRAGFCV